MPADRVGRRPSEPGEWLLTNGLGGYALGPLDGPARRGYHGWLVAATRPPDGRVLLVASIEASAVVDGVDQRLAVIRGALGDRPGAGVTASPDGPTGMGDEDLDVVVDAAVQEESSGQLGHLQVRGESAHTKAPEGTVPYRHAHATAKQAWPCRSGPGTSTSSTLRPRRRWFGDPVR